MFVFRSRRSNLVRKLWKLHQSDQGHGGQGGEAGGVSEESVTLNTIKKNTVYFITRPLFEGIK